MAAPFKSVVVTRPYQQVARQIEEQIRNQTFVRGQKLPTERAMGEQFGVSRTVVREALKFLGAMGLVESRQGSGVFVRNDTIPSVSRALTLSVMPEEESLHALFEFREPLETLAARYAARRRSAAQLAAIERRLAANRAAVATDDYDVFVAADQHFHAAIGDASGNAYLCAVVSAVFQMQGDVVRLVAGTVGSMTAAIEQHARVVAAIAARDPDEAAAAMREHVRYSAERLHRLLEARPGDRWPESEDGAARAQDQ